MTPWLAVVLSCGLAVVLGLALLLWRDMRYASRLSKRLQMVRLGTGPVAPAPGDSPPPMLRMITALGETIARSGALSDKTLDELRQTLHVAGFRGAHSLGLFVGTKVLLVIALPLAVLGLAWLLRLPLPYPVAILAVAAGMGLLAPDMIVRHLRNRYLRAVDLGMPDALDMMVICGQAGLGLEASIERVGIEIWHAHPVISGELSRTAREMQVSSETRLALFNFGKRTGLESTRRLAALLIQSMQYGTPLSVALRTLSAEQRQEMLARFEAKAGRLPALLTLPMIIFILPCVFLIVAGPAMVDVYRTMGR